MTRTCKACGRWFESRTRRTSYCSTACKQRAYRLRKQGTLRPYVRRAQRGKAALWSADAMKRAEGR